MFRILLASLLLAASAARADGPSAPRPIHVGIYLTQLSALDLKAHSFQADFWIWFRFNGEGLSPVDSFELVGGRVLSRGTVLKKALPNGETYQAVRVNALLQHEWDLHQFPLDDHRLRIRVEDSDQEAEQAVFVADAENEGVDPDLLLAGFRVTGHAHEVTTHGYASNYGDTSLAKGASSRYSRYEFAVDLARTGWGRFLKLFFGLFVATLVSWCSAFIRPKDASPRVSVSVGALFAASAVTVAINNQVPDTSYVTLADRLVYLSLGTILLSLVGTVLALSFHYRNEEARHRRLDRVSVFVLPSAYVLVLTALIALG